MERRVDPADGIAYTFHELSEYYKGKYKQKAIEVYWQNQCTQVKATRVTTTSRYSGSDFQKKRTEQQGSIGPTTAVILKLAVPQKMWGRLSGLGGSRLQELQEKYGVQIRIPWAKVKKSGGDKGEPTVDVIGSLAAAQAAWSDIQKCVGGRAPCVEEINITERDAARDQDEAMAASDLLQELRDLLEGLPSWETCASDERSYVWGAVAFIITPLLDDDESFLQKAAVAEDLQKMLRECDHPRALVFLFGSSITGLAERSADLDISCDINGDGKSPPPNESKLVESVMGKLKHRHQLKDLRCIPNARVPIVTHKPRNMDLLLGINGTTFDLSFRLLGAVNSRLLRHYVTGKPAVRIAAIVIKAWSKRVGITDSRNGYLTSYAVVIMLIYYLLRRGCTEWCAPLSIQLQDCERLPPSIGVIPHQSSQLQYEVGFVLGGFWNFYTCEFDWDSEVVSINESPDSDSWVGRMHKSEMGWDRPPAKDQQKELGRYNHACIADPYELRGAGEPGLNLARHMSEVKTAEVRLKFAKAWAAFTAADMEKAAGEFVASLSL